MQFKSLVRFFTSIGIDRDQLLTYDQQKLKKISLAEFSMSEAGFVEIDGFTYDKASILANIESVDFSAKLHWEILLFEKKNFLDFMEMKNTKVTYLINDDQFFNPEFTALYGAMISEAFAFQLRKKIQDKEWDRMASLLQLNALVLPRFEEEAFAPLRKFLDANSELIQLVDAANYLRKLDELEHWKNFSWDLVFNNLPISLQHYCNEYASTLTNYLAVILNRDNKTAIIISSYLIKLEHVEDHIKSLIINNHKFLAKSTSAETIDSSPNVKMNVKWLLTFFCMLGCVFFFQNSCYRKNASSSDYLYNNKYVKDNYQTSNSTFVKRNYQAYHQLMNYVSFQSFKPKALIGEIDTTTKLHYLYLLNNPTNACDQFIIDNKSSSVVSFCVSSYINKIELNSNEQLLIKLPDQDNLFISLLLTKINGDELPLTLNNTSLSSIIYVKANNNLEGLSNGFQRTVDKWVRVFRPDQYDFSAKTITLELMDHSSGLSYQIKENYPLIKTVEKISSMK